VKIVLLGDQSVGKTSIINCFIFDNFTGINKFLSGYSATVGVDFVSKTVNVDNKSLRMQSWVQQAKRDSIH
jgi:GTPase SAR1 family protein